MQDYTHEIHGIINQLIAQGWRIEVNELHLEEAWSLTMVPPLKPKRQQFLVDRDDSFESVDGLVYGCVGMAPFKHREHGEDEGGSFVIQRARWALTSVPSGKPICTLRTWRATFELAQELEPYGDLGRRRPQPLHEEDREQVNKIIANYMQWDEALARHLEHYPKDLPELPYGTSGVED